MAGYQVNEIHDVLTHKHLSLAHAEAYVCFPVKSTLFVVYDA